MLNGKRILGLIPARGGSKGLPGKNIRPMLGKPLIAWTIEAARGSRYLDRVVVTTDDQAIADVSLQWGAEVPFLRPAHLARDSAPSIEAIWHAMDWLDQHADRYDYLMLLEPTSPLRDAIDVDAAIGQLLACPEAESIVGVTQVEGAHPDFLSTMEAGFLRPMAEAGFTVKRRQDLTTYYFFEGSLYCSTYAALRAKGKFYHDKTLGYVVPRWKSYEVDDLSDFILIESLLKARQDGLLR